MASTGKIGVARPSEGYAELTILIVPLESRRAIKGLFRQRHLGESSVRKEVQGYFLGLSELSAPRKFSGKLNECS
jgi:hypothetical protein